MSEPPAAWRQYAAENPGDRAPIWGCLAGLLLICLTIVAICLIGASVVIG